MLRRAATGGPCQLSLLLPPAPHKPSTLTKPARAALLTTTSTTLQTTRRAGSGPLLLNCTYAAQGTATGLVNTGQQLLATSRQLYPQLQQLAAMSETSKQLRAQAERLRQLATIVLSHHNEHKQQQQQQQQ